MNDECMMTLYCRATMGYFWCKTL